MQPTTYYPLALAASFSALILAIFSLFYVRRQIRTVLRNREADLILKLYQASATREMEEAFNAVWSLEGNLPSEVQRPACERACVFFELVGTIVHCQYAGTELLEGLFGSLVTGSYDALKAYIDDMRHKPYNSNFALNFERLRNRLSGSAEVSPGPAQHEAARREFAKRSRVELIGWLAYFTKEES